MNTSVLNSDFEKENILKRLRFYQKVLSFSVFMFLVVLFFGTKKLIALPESFFLYPLGLLWLVLFCLGFLIFFAKCPACGERFFTKKIFGPFPMNNALSRECMHCGLQLYPPKKKS